jgi:hypothetical protein
VGLAVAAAAVLYHFYPRVFQLLGKEDTIRLKPAMPLPDPAPDLLIIAVDGIDRDLIYDMLRAGELPGFSALLGGEGLTHAHLDETMLSVLPSLTIPAWSTIFSGVVPAVHGVSGNEFFIREERRLAAPAPATFPDPEPVVANFLEGYAGSLIAVPTVYEQMGPAASIWVAMGHIHRGADRLIIVDRAALLAAGKAALQGASDGDTSFRVFSTADRELIENVREDVAKEGAPDVLTLYLAGPDHYAHVAEEGPDAARHRFLADVIDPELVKLAALLDAQGELAERFVILISDHGMTSVKHDDRHALEMEGEDEPPAALRRAGFRLRPFEHDVGPETDFDTVLAYQGSMAYVYLADRSACAPCDWSRPPRFTEDILAAAEVLYQANLSAPGLVDSFDLILTRRPRPYAEDDEPFQVYAGGGRLVPLETWIATHPRPDDEVDLVRRLRDLAAGPRGERAGDILVLSRLGEKNIDDRTYFSTPVHAWHGSASRRDSEVPLIVAHRGRSSAELGALTREVLGAHPTQEKAAELFLRLRQAGTSAKKK